MKTKNLFAIIAIIIIGFLFINHLQAQAIQWQKALGGYSDEHMDGDKLIKQTPDGGYIVAGSSRSNDTSVISIHGSLEDYWVVKLSASGNIQWQKTYGSTNDEACHGISLTSDGGYILAGESHGNNFDVTGNNGLEDYWIVKINSIGTIQWQKSLGGSNRDVAWGVCQSSDGSYYITGMTTSSDGDVTGFHGGTSYGDGWVVKLSSSGNLLWQKAIGGSNDEKMFSIVATVDGGCLVGGGTRSNDGDVVGSHGSDDYWMVKMDGTGTISWKKCYGGSGQELPNGGGFTTIVISVIQTLDNGFIIAGETASTDGDVTGTIGHIWLVKTDSAGTIQWQKRLGGTNNDEVNSIAQTSDGGYVINGFTQSTDGDITVVNYNNFDYFVMKVNSVGSPQWQIHLGGSDNEFPGSIIQTTDGGYLVGGISWSNDFDVTGNHGNGDYWIVKLSATVGMGNDVSAELNNLSIYPNPCASQLEISVSAGSTTKEVGSKEVRIMNMLGEEVKKCTMYNEQLTMDVSALSKGLYFVEVISAVSTGSLTTGSTTEWERTLRKKFIKE